MQTSEEAAGYLRQIVVQMVAEFGIAESEAFQCVDRHFRPYRFDLSDDERISLWFYRDSPQEWSRTIYLGRDHWNQAARLGRDNIPPLPMPEPGDPEFGGRALGEGAIVISGRVADPLDLATVASAVSGEPEAPAAGAFAFENEALTVSVLPQPDPEPGWLLRCRPTADARWSDVTVALRRIAYRLEQAGAGSFELRLSDAGGPVDLLDGDM